MVDRNTNLLEAFRTQTQKKRLEEPKALSSGIIQPVVGKKKKAKNVMIKLYVNGALLLISVALVFVAYRLAVLPEIFPPEAQAKQGGSTTTANMESTITGAENFANNFAFNWLAGDLQRATSYAANGFKFPENLSRPKPRIVSWNLVWYTKVKSAKEVNVVIQAGVKATETDSEKTVYLVVPVLQQSGKYGVSGLPTYLPFPGKATYTQVNGEQIQVTQADADAINKIVNLFFTEYYGGNPEKTSVYFADQYNRNILKDGELVAIQEAKILAAEKDNPNKVLVDVRIDMKMEGDQMPQNIKLYMTKNDNRWYIEKTDPIIPLHTTNKDGGA